MPKGYVYFSLVMGMVILFGGMLMLFSPPQKFANDPMISNLIGVAFLGYGAFRLLRAYKRYKEL